jgi:hypothetical protein
MQSPAQGRRALPPHRRAPGAPFSLPSQGSVGVAAGLDADEMDLQDPDNTFALDPEEDAALQQNLAETRIWGTDLNVQTCMNVFGVFLEYYGVGQNGSERSFYQQQLQYMHRTGDLLLNLNCSHLKAFPGE